MRYGANHKTGGSAANCFVMLRMFANRTTGGDQGTHTREREKRNPGRHEQNPPGPV